MREENRWVVLAVVLALALLWTPASILHRVAAGEQRSARDEAREDVIMMRCVASAFAVKAFVGSAAAPGKKTDNCPESLSVLLRDGFIIRDIGHYDHDEEFVVFTLVR